MLGLSIEQRMSLKRNLRAAQHKYRFALKDHEKTGKRGRGIIHSIEALTAALELDQKARQLNEGLVAVKAELSRLRRLRAYNSAPVRAMSLQLEGILDSALARATADEAARGEKEPT